MTYIRKVSNCERREVGEGGYSRVVAYGKRKVIKWLYNYSREFAELEFAVMDAAHECGVGPRVYELVHQDDIVSPYGIVVERCEVIGCDGIPEILSQRIKDRMGFACVDIRDSNYGKRPNGRWVLLDWSIECLIDLERHPSCKDAACLWEHLEPRHLRTFNRGNLAQEFRSSLSHRLR